MYAQVGIGNSPMQETANKQDEMFFIFFVIFRSGDTAFLLRTSLEIKDLLNVQFIRNPVLLSKRKITPRWYSIHFLCEY